MRAKKLESFTSNRLDGGRTTIDLTYLEEEHFHIERISDFITPSTPLFSIHQARTVLLFFYLITIAIIVCFIPQLIDDSTVISVFVICFPLICATIFHILTSFAYILFSLFSGASFRTIAGIHFYLHSIIGIVVFSLLMVKFARDIENPLFMNLVGLCAAFFVDFITGLYSSRNQRVFLLFEGIFIIPTLLLWSLYLKEIIPSHLYIFIPSAAFYFIYFTLMIGLSKVMPKFFNKISTLFFYDEAIFAEYEAADDYQSYWNSALWRDATATMDHGMKKKGKSSFLSSSSSSSSAENYEMFSNKGKNGKSGTSNYDEPRVMNAKKKDFRFPRKEIFQLYKLDEIPRHPFFICSLIPFIIFAGIIVLCLIESIMDISGFLIIFVCCFFVLLIFIFLNSRALPWYILSITNLSLETINIMWDHPSLSSI